MDFRNITVDIPVEQAKDELRQIKNDAHKETKKVGSFASPVEESRANADFLQRKQQLMKKLLNGGEENISLDQSLDDASQSLNYLSHLAQRLNKSNEKQSQPTNSEKLQLSKERN